MFSPTVLVSPLDWGLGHATRDIPIIRQLQGAGFKVIIASSGLTGQLLSDAFPELEILELGGYNIRYSRKSSMAIAMAYQLPSIYKTINYEHRWLDALLKHRNIDLIISDNRPGLYSNKLKSIYLTHQINILTPPGLRFLQPILYRIHLHLMQNFNEVWVPDFEGESNLSGILSHNSMLRSKIHFIGPQSRFSGYEPKNHNDDGSIDVLALISGPEPQRTEFENIVVSQLKASSLRAVVAVGLPGDSRKRCTIDGRIEIFPHLDDLELYQMAEKSKIIIARSGYSTIMDLFCFKKPAILVPTPGQTEQEYLAKRMMDLGWLYSVSQKDFQINRVMNEVSKYTGINLKNAICESIIQRIKELNL